MDADLNAIRRISEKSTWRQVSQYVHFVASCVFVVSVNIGMIIDFVVMIFTCVCFK